MIFALLQCCCRSTCSLSDGARAGGSVVWMILDVCGWWLIWLSFEHIGSFAWRFDRHKCLLPTVKTTQPSTCIYLVGYRLTIDWYGNIYHIYQLELRVNKRARPGWLNVPLRNRVSPTFRVCPCQKPHIHMANIPRKLLPADRVVFGDQTAQRGPWIARCEVAVEEIFKALSWAYHIISYHLISPGFWCYFAMLLAY